MTTVCLVSKGNAFHKDNSLGDKTEKDLSTYVLVKS